MRRWFTWLDGAEQLDFVWHTLLLGLLATFYLKGEDCDLVVRGPQTT